uniref:mRNA interferase YafQ n=1 Tax=Curvibacter symbiont subsp. Hydra magnipapillata TaxID=667019 RepID=C9Y6Q8_CURXX|nr:hypothetical protein Csp_E36350 [Curvibacter putative symbiont of Hydra magnipapillata]
MRDLFSTTVFQKDLKREYSSFSTDEKSKQLRRELALVIGRLMFDVSLEIHHKDHRLTGNWNGYRDCHVFNNLVLIYRKFDKKDMNKNYGENAIVFARLGSHSELDL